MSSTTSNSAQFRRVVKKYYREKGRHHLPWRETTDPYKILVSEVMLQQTQVDRVLPKYNAFITKWGSTRRLAAAPLGDVLKAWQGLGYNRRAKMLHECAKRVVAEYDGTFPESKTELEALPGIGPYTAGAVMAFAYNKPVVMIETNIRTVYLHHFFNDQTDVDDKEIINLVEKTVDAKNSREWYWALMDYGAYLKKQYGNLNSRSKHYTKQSIFKGSDRQIRGAILKVLSEEKIAPTRKMLLKKLSHFEDIRIDAQLAKLTEEGMISKIGQRYALPS